MARPNVRMIADDLMIAQVKRAQDIRNRQVEPMKDYDIEILAYWCVFFVVMTGIVVVLALA